MSDNIVTLSEILECDYRNIFPDVELDTNWRDDLVIIGFSTEKTQRTILYKHKLLNDYIFKVYNNGCGQYNPLSHLLRAPMSKKINQVIQNENLTLLEELKEALIPNQIEVYETWTAEEFNQNFVVIAEYKDLYTKDEMISNVKALDSETQIRLCSQLCTVILKTQLSDFGWENIRQSKVTGKFIIIDTEPLRGEIYHPNYTSKHMYPPAENITQGIDQFHICCKNHKMPIFIDTILKIALSLPSDIYLNLGFYQLMVKK
jgi:hypothetical protein